MKKRTAEAKAQITIFTGSYFEKACNQFKLGSYKNQGQEKGKIQNSDLV